MHHLCIIFHAGREYEFHVHADELQSLGDEEAREWLHEEFDELECTPSNPVGKVLILDVILNVAKYGGENRFAQGDDWAHQFVRCVARVLDRPSIRIDVPGFVVG